MALGYEKGLLADFVVGTVDQVLMMALQVRHSMLRHLALAGKVIIIDEVHSYDTYMSAYLSRALSWLARYGATVVLMSATLPKAQKEELVAAFSSQVTEAVPELDSTAYPLVTTVSTAGIEQLEVASRATDLEASVQLIDDSIEKLAVFLEDQLSDGGCALIVCNTVRRAQESYRRLSEVW